MGRWRGFRSGCDGGADAFVFAENNGEDFIYDFEQGKDIIEVDMPDGINAPIPAIARSKLAAQAVERLTEPYDFSDLTIEETGDDSVIHFDDSNSVTVYGVTGITESDFIFA